MIPTRIFYDIRKRIDGLEGGIAEVGVYTGGSALQICQAFPEDTIHLFDTFKGIPACKVSDIDGHKGGDFVGTEDTVARKLRGKTYRMYKGIFPDTGPLCDVEQFKFVHVDVDIYQTTRDCLEYFWPRMVPGGIILDDDYGSYLCEGARLAVDEFGCEYDVKIQVSGSRAFVQKPIETGCCDG